MASALFSVTSQMFKLLSKIQKVVCDWNCWAGTSFLACKIKGVVTGELHVWHSLTTREMQNKVAARAPLRCEMLSRSARFHPFCFSTVALTFKRLSEIGKVWKSKDWSSQVCFAVVFFLRFHNQKTSELHNCGHYTEANPTIDFDNFLCCLVRLESLFREFLSSWSYFCLTDMRQNISMFT